MKNFILNQLVFQELGFLFKLCFQLPPALTSQMNSIRLHLQKRKKALEKKNEKEKIIFDLKKDSSLEELVD